MLRAQAPLTVADLQQNGILAELALRFNNRDQQQGLLLRINFPLGMAPVAPDAAGFWLQTCMLIDGGLTAGGQEALLAAAADAFPFNRVFAPWRREESKPGSRADSGSSIVITGRINVPQVLARARAFSQERGLGNIELGVVTEQIAQIRLPDATPEQALELAEELRSGGLLSSRPRVVPNQFRDYLLQSLYVEGPDTGRFELNDVPASTPVRDIARATMAEYADEMWPRDNQGRARPATVDCVETEGSRRLDPDSTLHDNGIQEGATLHVAPQSTAGINPHIRDEALARVRAQVVAYAQAHPGFEVQANSAHAPTEYLFRFQAPGWGPPADPNGEPYPVDVHEVFLVMPPEFPMMAPTAFWQTPIYHPNIDRLKGTGKVCLGALEDRYRPGMDFGELCQMLMDMASYQNYEVAEGYDEEARNWAVSPAGQVAIEQRGGRSVLRQLLLRFQDELQAPYPLQIRRLDE